MRTFAIGDIHGAHKALKQVLERSNFDYENDRLIVLGDVVDGWPETPQVIEELLKIKDMVLIMGNHDHWADGWFEFGWAPMIWMEQGGRATVNAYLQHPELMVKHRDFFKQAHYYFIDENNRIYLHGGFQRGIDIKAQLPAMFMWDRTLATKAANSKTGKESLNVHEYSEVYLGHTTINSFKNLAANKPHIGGNVILLDTGAGWEGVLTIMNVDTKEYFQSDIVAALYPEVVGRSGKKFNSSF